MSGVVDVVMDLPIGQLRYDQGQGLQPLKDLNATLALASFDDHAGVFRWKRVDPFKNLIAIESCERSSVEQIRWRIVSCQVAIVIYGELQGFPSVSYCADRVERVTHSCSARYDNPMCEHSV